MESFVPRRALRDRVLSIERVQSPGHSSHVLPSAGAVLGIQVSGRIVGPEGSLSPFGVTGIPDGARRYRYDGPTETFLVRFRPQGAACLGVPARLLAARSLSVDELWGAPDRKRAEALRETMLLTPDMQGRVALLENFLLALPFRRDPRLERALALLDRGALLEPSAEGDEGARVSFVAEDVGLSERQLERLFLERVGVSPKRYARLRRFERGVRLTREGRPLGEVAVACGYADQAHFIREFQRFAGTTPGRFSRASDFVG